MADQQQTIFRKKTLERISSPDQLTDYLCVTNPGIWLILLAIIFLMAGLLAWSAMGTLETTTPVKVVVEDHKADVIPLKGANLEAGMTLSALSEKTVIASTKKDEYDRICGLAEINLPDGSYDGKVVVERIHPISFLTEGR